MQKRYQIELLKIVRRGFQYHLVLEVTLQTVWVLGVPAVCRPARWLDVRSPNGLRPNGAQESGRMERASAHLHIVRLQNQATLFCPVVLEAQNDALEVQG